MKWKGIDVIFSYTMKKARTIFLLFFLGFQVRPTTALLQPVCFVYLVQWGLGTISCGLDGPLTCYKSANSSIVDQGVYDVSYKKKLKFNDTNKQQHFNHVV